MSEESEEEKGSVEGEKESMEPEGSGMGGPGSMVASCSVRKREDNGM